MNASINIDDVAIIKNENAYFEQYKLEFSEIINKTTLVKEEAKTLIGKLINLSDEKNMLNLRHLLNANDSAYELLLMSDSISFEQDKIEGLISDKVSDCEMSILDIGLMIDKEIFYYEEKISTSETYSRINEETLIRESFISITQKKSKFYSI